MVMAHASAEITRQCLLDFFLGGMRIFLKQSFGGHDDSGGAKAALESVVLDKSLLQRIELAGSGISQPLNGCDGFAIAFNGEYFAGIDGFAVHDHSAGATGALTAGNFGPR
jgi:hypothetical protein